MKRRRDIEQVIATYKDEHVCFRFEDGCTLDAAREVVEGSKLLREALCDASDASETSLQVPEGMLQIWLQCREQQQPFTVQFLQVRAH